MRASRPAHIHLAARKPPVHPVRGPALQFTDKFLAARVSSLLYQHGANILHADQHQDPDLDFFFMRVEWALNRSSGDAATGQTSFDLDGFKTVVFD
jgi:hypothetical protein